MRIKHAAFAQLATSASKGQQVVRVACPGHAVMQVLKNAYPALREVSSQQKVLQVLAKIVQEDVSVVWAPLPVMSVHLVTAV